MNQKNQLLLLIVLLVVIAVSVVIVLPNRTPGEVEIVSTETGDSVLVSDYVARYTDIDRGRTEDGGYVLGSADAPVTIVEFADFMCPHCQTYHETVRQFIEQYVATGQAKFEYRLFPIVNPELSVFTAQLAECVDTQQPGLFWAAHDLLFDLAALGQISKETTPAALAEALKVDVAALNTCLETAKQYETDIAIGDAAGVNGTPATLVRLDAETIGWGYVDGQVYNRGGM
ncbi:MAG: thioredoxin domain-containing protein, partial [Anaerolineae bacterium]|nr:thioredoxin domain-containing protein [Anaerolineae bacterium]